jgi:hypothetical protein
VNFLSAFDRANLRERPLPPGHLNFMNRANYVGDMTRDKGRTKQRPRALQQSAPQLVYLEDRGAVYDAPISVVWDFWLKDEVFHPKAHRSTVRNFREKKLSEVTTLLTYEQRHAGRWVKMACRMTTVPPAVRVQEDLQGPYAGSIKVFLYTPNGPKTTVDVIAYMRSRELTPKQIETDTRRRFADAYREDLPWFRKYVRSLEGN